jgi:hypothetical protein
MNTERYLKLAALAALLIIALAHPVVAALVLTGVAAWRLERHRISDMAIVEKVVRLTPAPVKEFAPAIKPAIKQLVKTRSANFAPSVKLALAPPDPVRDTALPLETKTPEPIVIERQI